MKEKLCKYRDVCLLLAAFCVLAAVVLLNWRSVVRGLPDTVGRSLTQGELAQVLERNSPLTQYVYLSPNADFPRQDSIRKITIHHMADDIPLERLGEVFAEEDRQASANYAVDGRGRVALRGRRRGDRLILEIENNGGLSREDEAHIARLTVAVQP